KDTVHHNAMNLKPVQDSAKVLRAAKNGIGGNEPSGMAVRAAGKACDVDPSGGELGGGLKIGLGKPRNPHNQNGLRRGLCAIRPEKGCRGFAVVPKLMGISVRYAGAGQKGRTGQKL